MESPKVATVMDNTETEKVADAETRINNDTEEHLYEEIAEGLRYQQNEKQVVTNKSSNRRRKNNSEPQSEDADIKIHKNKSASAVGYKNLTGPQISEKYQKPKNKNSEKENVKVPRKRDGEKNLGFYPELEVPAAFTVNKPEDPNDNASCREPEDPNDNASCREPENPNDNASCFPTVFIRTISKQSGRVKVALSLLLVMSMVTVITVPTVFGIIKGNKIKSTTEPTDIRAEKRIVPNSSTENMNIPATASYPACNKTSSCPQKTIKNCTEGDDVSARCHEFKEEPRKDCLEIFEAYKNPGVYKIQPIGSAGFDAYCDQGWTTIMRRFDGSQDFYLYWDNYKNGFGNKSGEYWLGNDNLYYISNQGNYTLRLEFTYWGSKWPYWAEYTYFKVANEAKEYRLSVSAHIGNSYNDILSYHNNQAFSTRDRDNDERSSRSCAQEHKGGFWYKDCLQTNPTGPYQRSRTCMGWKTSSWQCSSAFTIKMKALKM